jgi:hypothetical protein
MAMLMPSNVDIDPASKNEALYPHGEVQQSVLG